MSCVFWGQRQGAARVSARTCLLCFPVHGLRASATAGWLSCGVLWRELGFTVRVAFPQCALRVRGESCGLFLWRGPFSRHQEMWRELRSLGAAPVASRIRFFCFSCPWTARQRHGGMDQTWCAVA